MKNENPVSAIASFAVLKALNDSKKYRSPYQLLSGFIEFIICNEQLHSFTPAEMKFKLKTHFGFNVPEAVIQASLRNIKYAAKSNNAYIVDLSACDNSDRFANTKNEAELKYGEIVESIVSHVKKSYPKADNGEIVKAIISYLIDDDDDREFRAAISGFIMENEKNDELQRFLNNVREGGILYLGINRNISEWGSLKHELTLYLDTEILFDLVGFNGSVYQELADDFYRLVKRGKCKGRITLKYFVDVKSEIERFYKSAERIVEGREPFFDAKPAMKQIVNGCQTSADVRVKEADFFTKLRSYGIIEDEVEDYYSEELKKYNLEHSDCTSDREREGWKAVSHINKLRRGHIADFELDSRFLIVTDSLNVLAASNAQCKNDKKYHSRSFAAQYAVNLNRIASLLWYKLDGGFGGEKFPSNALVLFRARVVLSEIISKKVSELYKENIDQYTKGEINQEQLAARIIALRDKPSLPEEVRSDNYAQGLDFSIETIDRIEIELQANKQYREDQEKLVQDIRAFNQKILAEKDNVLNEKNRVIQEQNEELSNYREKENARKKRIRTLQNVGSIIGRGAVALVIVLLVWYAKFKCDDMDRWIQFVLDGAAIIGLYFTIGIKLRELWRSRRRRT